MKSVASKKQIVKTAKMAAKHAAKEGATEAIETRRTLAGEHEGNGAK